MNETIAKTVIKFLSVLAAVMLVAATVLGCSGGAVSAPTPSNSASEDVAASENSIETDYVEPSGGGVAEDVSANEVSSENMPVPDFAKLFTLNRAEAAAYLAVYPHDEYAGRELVDLVSWAEFYSSDALKEVGINWMGDVGEGVRDAGSWSMSLEYFDDSEYCDIISFQMSPLTSGEGIATTEAYALMIENYLSDYDIHEMTLAVIDTNVRPYDGYILFDNLQATPYSGSAGYTIFIYPNPNPEPGGYNWEETKSDIAKGYISSGSNTYSYVDVYTTADDL